MSCGFTLDHYRELLRAARAGGYRFSHFDEPPRRGDLLLRHDVDLSLDAALRMAALEAEEGATATYFLMTESVFYNLASTEGVGAAARLRELGHRVGPARRLSHRRARRALRPRVAWHNPDPEYMTAPIPGAVNVMQDGYFDPPTLPLRLEPAVALGLPARGAPQRRLPVAPAADAPGDLGLSRRDDGCDHARDARRRA